MKVDIQPVQVFPGTANRLFISDQFEATLNSTPEFNCALYAVTKTTTIGGVLETEETLKSAIIVKMTPQQWSAWSSQSAEAYVKECVLENLGLTAA